MLKKKKQDLIKDIWQKRCENKLLNAIKKQEIICFD